MQIISTTSVKFLILLSTLCHSAVGFAWTEKVESVQILDVKPTAESDFRWQMDLLIGARQETLLLNPSNAVNNANILTQDGSKHRSSAHFYAGKVQNINNSWVRLSESNNQLHGIIAVAGQHYQLNPSDTRISHSFIQPLDTDAADLTPHTGGDQQLFPPPERAVRTPREAVVVQAENPNFFNQNATATTVVHIGIVIDTLYNEAVAGRGLDRARSIINAVDGLYREQLGIAISLDTTVIMTDPETDPLSVENMTTPDMLLEFRNYRRTADILGTDLSLVHFFTGNHSIDNNIGLAFIGSACRSDGYDVSLSIPFQFATLLAAHEIGHNLGALHDEDTECSSLGDGIMYSQISSLTENMFSACSIDAIQQQKQRTACHSNAIDISLELTPNDDATFTATMQNLDLIRAIPGAQLKFELQNARIISAPASCKLEGSNEAQCPLISISADTSRTLKIEYELTTDDATVANVHAALLPIGFVDLQTHNNELTIVLPQRTTPTTEPGESGVVTTTESTTETPLDNDAQVTEIDPASANIEEPETGGDSGGSASFGLLLLLLAFRRQHTPLHTPVHFRQLL